MLRKFWPRGDDSYSSATRLKTAMIVGWYSLWLVAGAGIAHHLRNFCS